jgi:hypothetical protein
VLELEGKTLRHLAAPHLPARYKEAVDGIEIGPARGPAAPPQFAVTRSTSPIFRPTRFGRAGPTS